MLKYLFRASVAVVMSASTCFALADSLAGNSPFAAVASGQQSDASAEPAFSQTISLPSKALVDSITWWGFHGSNSGGSAYDDFVVTLDGAPVIGSLVVDNTNQLFSQYTLSFAPTLSSATSLSVANNSLDVEWFWQSATALGGGPDAFNVAYRIDGAVQQPIPEPSSILLAVAGLAFVLVRQSAKRHKA